MRWGMAPGGTSVKHHGDTIYSGVEVVGSSPFQPRTPSPLAFALAGGKRDGEGGPTVPEKRRHNVVQGLPAGLGISDTAVVMATSPLLD